MLERNNELPLVSIIVPAYNHEKYIENCIDSIINQSYKNIEVIIINDGSTDRTLSKLSSYKNFEQVKIINQENKGLCKTLNLGLSLTKGKYISILASDDYLINDKLEKQVAFLEYNPQYGMCCAKAYEVDDAGKNLGTVGAVVDENELSFQNLLDGNKIAILTALLKSNVFDEVGGFDEGLYMEDWDMWLRVSNKYKIGFLNEFVAYYRKHETNISSKINLMERCKIQTIKKWRNLDNYPIVYKRQILRSFNELAGKDKINAFKFIKEVIPFWYAPYFYRGFLKLLVKW
ncbi:glycosyltransferase family 2 protein [Flavobacterium sp. GSB-24]|uniref:glycosyltransferase family 2 protein n=1 Tax=Flavobacterium sp. GSB-24 TaxID=2994319 RepID=UPI002493BC8E|nr:glycosyltransferase family 2 protein [Flavobacterium sp. GSB-24]BDU23580.1 alpha-1,3-rhamnosyltransferase WapR [Flavobacterium sp. GSB-24]